MVPRELQQGLDQLKKEFEDLKRDHELGLKRKAECEANNGRCINEVATLRKTLEVLHTTTYSLSEFYLVRILYLFSITWT